MKARVSNTILQLSNPAFTLEEWRPEDAGLSISWKIADTKIGEALIASTTKGVCFLGFTNGDPAFALSDLKRRFLANVFTENNTEWLNEAIAYLNQPGLNLLCIYI